jgi:hypothetical protein
VTLPDIETLMKSLMALMVAASVVKAFEQGKQGNYADVARWMELPYLVPGTGRDEEFEAAMSALRVIVVIGAVAAIILSRGRLARAVGPVLELSPAATELFLGGGAAALAGAAGR